MAVSTQDSGRETKFKDLEFLSHKTDFMLVNGRTIKWRGMDFYLTKTNATSENLKMIMNTGMGLQSGKIGWFTKDFGRMVSSMALGLYLHQKGLRKENGN